MGRVFKKVFALNVFQSRRDGQRSAFSKFIHHMKHREPNIIMSQNGQNWQNYFGGFPQVMYKFVKSKIFRSRFSLSATVNSHVTVFGRKVQKSEIIQQSKSTDWLRSDQINQRKARQNRLYIK